MEPTSASQPCPCCGGTLNFKITVERLKAELLVRFHLTSCPRR